MKLPSLYSSSPRKMRLGVFVLVLILLVSMTLPQSTLAASTWTNVASMNVARIDHTATLLPSGKVLVAGGQGATYDILNNAEVYDPTTNIWMPVAPMTFARANHTATLLTSGKVLVAGGTNGSPILTAELYDPTANTWTVVGSLTNARLYHTATLLPSGKATVEHLAVLSCMIRARLHGALLPR
jgi:hypothetical protein